MTDKGLLSFLGGLLIFVYVLSVRTLPNTQKESFL